MGFSGTSENRVFSPEDKDVALWLLISTNSGPGLKQESQKGFMKEVVGDDHVLQLLFSQLFEFVSGEFIDVVIPRHTANATHMEGVGKVLEKYLVYCDQVKCLHGPIPNSHEPIKVLHFVVDVVLSDELFVVVLVG